MSSTHTLLNASPEIGPTGTPGHVHRWRIDEQGGPDSAGTCRCGTARRFQNGWGGDSTLVLGSGNWVAASRRRSGGFQR